MKTKFFSQITILLFVIALVSCQREETNPNNFPSIGETSGNYIACKLDGADYVSMAFQSMFANQVGKPFIGTQISDNGKTIYGYVNFYQDSMRSAEIKIKLYKKPIINQPILLSSDNFGNSVETPIGSNFKFNFSGNQKFIQTLYTPSLLEVRITAGYEEYKTTNFERGEITFSLVDTANQIYQGTFWADIKFHKWDTKGQSQPWPNTEDYWNLVAQRTNIDTNKVIRVRDGRFYFNAAKSDLRIDRR